MKAKASEEEQSRYLSNYDQPISALRTPSTIWLLTRLLESGKSRRSSRRNLYTSHCLSAVLCLPISACAQSKGNLVSAKRLNMAAGGKSFLFFLFFISYREDGDVEHFKSQGDVVEDARSSGAAELDGVGNEEFCVWAAADDDHLQWMDHFQLQLRGQSILLLWIQYLLPVRLLDEKVYFSITILIR